MSRPRIYISGPISKGNWSDNFHAFCKAFEKLKDMDCAAFNPGKSMLYPGNQNIPHHVWLEIDLAWVEVADAVFLIPGESTGAEMECAHAKERGIPVFVTYHDLEVFLEARRAVA